jgi:AbrB family looped-hinge helix DNA binding protein
MVWLVIIPLVEIVETVVSVDKAGRVVLPKKVRKKFGLSGKGILAMELRESEVVLRKAKSEQSPSKAISKMNVPAGSWNRIEKEMEEGAAEG